jgi:hypothetical protein
MPGKLTGFYFKQVVGELLTPQVLIPEYKRKIDAMRDNEWYDWDEYVNIVNVLAYSLDPAVVCDLGKGIVTQAKELFISQGFDSPDVVLKDWYALFMANVKGAPERDGPHTTFYEPGHVVVEANTAQPQPLIEGYLRGVVDMFGCQVLRFKSEKMDSEQGPQLRFEIWWH